MSGRKEIGGKQGPVTALFVLFGLLLNVATAAGALDRDPRSARLGSGEIVRTAANSRLASRVDDDGSDRDEVLASLPPAPQLVSLVAVSYPAGRSGTMSAAIRPVDSHSPYQARAPPAA